MLTNGSRFGGENMSKKRRNKKPTLAYQIRDAINKNFQEGTSKRAAKLSETGTGSTVYSYAHRKNLIQFGTQFANYCRDEFKIKEVKDIKAEHIDKFLEHKSKTCADTTLGTYFQHIKKINKCVNDVYGSCKENWSEGVLVPGGANKTQLRSVKMSRESMDKVLNNLDMRIESHRGIFIAEALGTRVEETVTMRGRDINIEKGTVYIPKGNAKGGREREVPIPEGKIEVFKAFKEEFGDSRIVDIRKDSLNDEFRDLRTKLEVHDLDGHKTGIHAIRKLYCTEHFDELVASGMSKKEAWDEVCDLIGHGENRNDLFKKYVIR